MNGYKTTRVWIIDNKLVVADTIEDAISLYKKYYNNHYTSSISPDIKNVKAVGNASMVRDYDAIIKEE